MVTIPLESVAFRSGAILRKEMLVVLEESATKKNIKAETSTSGGAGLDLETVVSLQAQVRAADGDGEIFGFDGGVYRGTGASPGSVWLAPDARKVQYRLYYEVAGAVYSDGLLRQHDLPPDSELTRSAEPPSRRKRVTRTVPVAG